jgi:exodeoxyribonuclease III
MKIQLMAKSRFDIKPTSKGWRDRWPLDKGMRLDHFHLSPTVSDRLMSGDVDRWVRGEENASDHAPAWIVLDR